MKETKASSHHRHLSSPLPCTPPYPASAINDVSVILHELNICLFFRGIFWAFFFNFIDATYALRSTLKQKEEDTHTEGLK